MLVVCASIVNGCSVGALNLTRLVFRSSDFCGICTLLIASHSKCASLLNRDAALLAQVLLRLWCVLFSVGGGTLVIDLG